MDGGRCEEVNLARRYRLQMRLGALFMTAPELAALKDDRRIRSSGPTVKPLFKLAAGIAPAVGGSVYVSMGELALCAEEVAVDLDDKRDAAELF
jgi:hypothetical protein